ncbi:MAG: proline dehydrogenase family protein [Conexibacteraceae bacterium]|nr:proline dehydrogenase family protein [Conexibacteraceae bacterium]
MTVTLPTTEEIERETLSLGRRLWQHQRRHRRVGRRSEDRAMAAMTAEPGLRAAVFRLVDVAPACDGGGELAEHLGAYLDEIREPSGLVARSRRMLHGRLGSVAGGRAAGTAVRAIADRFIVGESVGSAVPVLAGLWADGTASTVDLLGEATVTPAEGDAYAERCLDALRTLHAAVEQWPARPLLEHDAAGALPRVNLSVKVTALTPLVRPQAPERARDDAGRRLLELLRAARLLGAHLHIDMESFDSHELILELALELLSREEFADGPSAGIVLQAYLRDSEETLARVLDWAAGVRRSVPLTVRLVKGAYWDHEMIEATQRGWEAPVWTDKRESDRCFERLTRALIDAFPLVRPAIASHNLRSVAHAVAYARARGLGQADVELQVLRGLGDELQRALAAEGLRCRTYCPVGDLVAGMAYLVRRLLENTSNASFLTSSAAGVELDELLRCP